MTHRPFYLDHGHSVPSTAQSSGSSSNLRLFSVGINMGSQSFQAIAPSAPHDIPASKRYTYSYHAFILQSSNCHTLVARLPLPTLSEIMLPPAFSRNVCYWTAPDLIVNFFSTTSLLTYSPHSYAPFTIFLFRNHEHHGTHSLQVDGPSEL